MLRHHSLLFQRRNSKSFPVFPRPTTSNIAQQTNVESGLVWGKLISHSRYSWVINSTCKNADRKPTHICLTTTLSSCKSNQPRPFARSITPDFAQIKSAHYLLVTAVKFHSRHRSTSDSNTGPRRWSQPRVLGNSDQDTWAPNTSQ